MKKRFDFIDGVKFFAMFLCVLGHMIQNGSYHPSPEDWNEDYIFLFMQHFVLEYHKICQIERRTLCHLKSIC